MQKTVLIIGGGGIGGYTAKRLAKKNYAVYNASPEPLEIHGVTDLQLDVCDKNATQGIIDMVGKHGLYALIYTAGASMAAPFEYTEEEDYRRIFEINYFGFIKAAQSAVKHMKARGGKIIAVGSMGGTYPLIYDPFYSASKAAIDMTVKEMNAELNRFGITASSVLAGGTATPFSFHRKIYGEERAGEYNADMLRAANSLISSEQNGDSPDLVAKQIVRIIERKNPSATTAVGVKNKALRFAKRLLPEKLVLSINAHMQI